MIDVVVWLVGFFFLLLINLKSSDALKEVFVFQGYADIEEEKKR